MWTLHWALSSREGVKEAHLEKFPYFEFPGWMGTDLIQSYIEHVKLLLPDEEYEESKSIIDTLLPQEAVNMLYERLMGRFRPIVTAMYVKSLLFNVTVIRFRPRLTFCALIKP